MLLFGIFLGELLVLFFLSQFLTKALSRILYRLFHSTEVVIHILSVIFLPGVIVHELSHLFVANILFVPTGEIEFFPEIHGNTVKMGSVAIAHTDPLRRFVIGVAPLFVGTLVIFLLCTLLCPSVFFSWQTLFLAYTLFEVGNTMFSSSKDMEGALGLLLVLAILLGGALFFKIPLLNYLTSFSEIAAVAHALLYFNWYLLIAIGIDCVCIVLAKLSERVRR